MRLCEDESKQLFAAYGIPIPPGESLTAPGEVAAAYARLAGDQPVVLKAQIPAGKRGKLGAIAFAESAAAAAAAFERLRTTAFAGLVAQRVRMEQRVAVARELYMAITVDDVSGQPVFLLSASGGVDVEEAAALDPAAVHVEPLDVRYGLQGYHVRAALLALGIEHEWHAAVRDVAQQLYRVFAGTGALLVEINPLAAVDGGQVVALDGKVILDDYRVPTDTHPVIRAAVAARATVDESIEAERLRHGVQYVDLGGPTGLISVGAGVGLQVVDWLDLLGAPAAGFVDLTPAFRDGGGPARAIDYLLQEYDRDPAIRAVLIALAIGSRPVGALGALAMASLEQGHCRKPVVFYCGGNSGEAARQALRAGGYRVGTTMEEAVRMVVESQAPAPGGGRA